MKLLKFFKSEFTFLHTHIFLPVCKEKVLSLFKSLIFYLLKSFNLHFPSPQRMFCLVLLFLLLYLSPYFLTSSLRLHLLFLFILNFFSLDLLRNPDLFTESSSQSLRANVLPPTHHSVSGCSNQELEFIIINGFSVTGTVLAQIMAPYIVFEMRV